MHTPLSLLVFVVLYDVFRELYEALSDPEGVYNLEICLKCHKDAEELVNVMKLAQMQKDVTVFRHALIRHFLGGGVGGAIAGLGHNNEIHGIVAGSQKGQLFFKQFVGAAVIRGVFRLNDTNLHGFSPFRSVSEQQYNREAC